MVPRVSIHGLAVLASSCDAIDQPGLTLTGLPASRFVRLGTASLGEMRVIERV